jgi:hypothetical protein
LCIALFVSIGVSLYNRGLSGKSSYWLAVYSVCRTCRKLLFVSYIS